MSNAQEPANREELIAAFCRVQTIALGKQFSVDRIKLNQIAAEVQSILDRETPKLVPCGVCGEPAYQDKFGVIHCNTNFPCIQLRGDDVDEVVKHWNTANAAIREMRTG